MKKITVLLIAVAMVLGLSVSAHAILIDNGDGTITHTASDGSQTMWMQDVKYAMTSGYDADGIMTWAEADAWVSGLSFAGYDDWRLPDCTVCVGSAFTEFNKVLYENPTAIFINFDPVEYSAKYWVETNWTLIIVDPFGITGLLDSTGGSAYAWVVRDIPASVPEPSTLLLLGSGLVGLGFVRRRVKG